jgi:excisionase family DNA binding protein
MPPEAAASRPAAEPLLVDAREAARRLSLSEKTVKRMAYSGELPCRKVRRRLLFSTVELAEWVAGGCKAPSIRLRRQGGIE